MEITKTFTVAAAPDAVWALLTDPGRVAACLPGAAITGQVDENTYTGTITVRVGPVSTSYRGTVVFERLDPDARVAEISATGQDVRGKGGAQLHMTSRLAESAAGQTEVSVASDVSVTGILAQMGRGMIQDVSDQMFQQFTEAVRAQLASAVAAPTGGAALGASAPSAPPAPAEPVQVVSLGAKVLGRALGRAARRPMTWVVILVVALLIGWLLHR